MYLAGSSSLQIQSNEGTQFNCKQNMYFCILILRIISSLYAFNYSTLSRVHFSR
ncbi:hypothetical protein Scep_022390 [Stephania cephalantha]|uniref:Uncharacterized protein n=1 Tax=Stephania cephalantha TaxID=152367 RepID=A0AAP0F5B1_9MAGN